MSIALMMPSGDSRFRVFSGRSGLFTTAAATLSLVSGIGSLVYACYDSTCHSIGRSFVISRYYQEVNAVPRGVSISPVVVSLCLFFDSVCIYADLVCIL